MARGTKTGIVAFHGMPGNGQLLARDIDIQNWLYPNWKLIAINRLVTFLQEYDQLILVGYSAGVSLIARLTHFKTLLPRIKGAILYEGTVLRKEPLGTFPITWIENDQGVRTWSKRRERKMDKGLELWSKSRRLIYREGKGTHIRTNPIGHGWDQTLNPSIKQDINFMLGTQYVG